MAIKGVEEAQALQEGMETTLATIQITVIATEEMACNPTSLVS